VAQEAYLQAASAFSAAPCAVMLLAHATTAPGEAGQLLYTNTAAAGLLAAAGLPPAASEQPPPVVQWPSGWQHAESGRPDGGAGGQAWQLLQAAAWQPVTGGLQLTADVLLACSVAAPNGEPPPPRGARHDETSSPRPHSQPRCGSSRRQQMRARMSC